jgi:serine/threonine protein kinase
MARRLPSTPPVLPGFSFVRALGSGGFADVFLYEQNLPRRQVAVKVLLPEVVNPRVRNMFQAEAQLMAQLSTHPAILTVFEASVSSDGRPYLVTEMCPSGYGDRFRSERIPVPEVLRTGIKISAALETAHRANVLHRDLKPGNILLTAYGHPVLSDFGIAASLAQGAAGQAVGLSVPWSAPEVVREETTGTIASEIFALGATVYSLLAGRSPFEIEGKENSPGHLAGRILRGKILPLGREDVPVTLENLLARALSRRPEDRPHSAMEFARELQAVESELHLAQTSIDVVGDAWSGGLVVGEEDRTALAVLRTIDTPWWRRSRGANRTKESRHGATPS